VSINNVFRAVAGAFDRVRPEPVAAAYSGVIGKIDVQLLRVACPERTEADLAPWVEPIQKACKRFDINSVRRVAAFISQMAHESSLKPGREENLNYSAKRLAEVWQRYAANPNAKPKDRQPNALANRLARNPEAIANNVYAGRMGNGSELSGDGWKFRGQGPGQLTGRSNLTGFADVMGMTIDEALEYIRTIEGGVMSFAWFWNVNDLNRLADTPGVTDETRRINGGTHGLADREARFNRTVAALLAAGA
jgi:putative chitinase